ncbi:D-alanyl-D-alanine carboxypeptidase [Humitalea rosea]|uniref:D-alanyl-D-alanine carboxypeptidase n=1 Tax=Humitalea rosea TaxID=990373 RepID=A0A2W7KKJ9_9PROT|nr:D-alanyl-D-alanine carboxypeptidase family protein [Humitalea rosea]PZW48665.1 D-alanyl-D-alanine carboxypeptidase [Humitalea rosea]
MNLPRIATLLGRLAFAGLAFSLFASRAQAQIGSDRYSGFVQNLRSGEVLVAINADETRHPASLTKMMTLYMVFEAVREGRLRLDQHIAMTEDAAAMPPSKLGLPPGTTLTVEQGILSLVTKSANDVAALFGETLSGSEARFAQAMTLRARALGMAHTTFRNASGLPDLDQVTTARDMALLGRRLFTDFPQHYHYFSTVRTRVAGVQLRSHNRMLDSYEGADGIKTGYISASGFNIVTSAQRDGVRLIGAVFGGSSWFERDQHMAALLDQGFIRSGVAIAVTAPVATRSTAIVSRASAASVPARMTNRSATAAARAAASRPAASRGSTTRQAAARATRSARPAQAARQPQAARPSRSASRPVAAPPVIPARSVAPRPPARTHAPSALTRQVLQPPVPREPRNTRG